MLDQRKLPTQEEYATYTDVDGVANGIRAMVIRGAPAIGVAAGYGVALAAHTARPGDDLDQVLGRSFDLLSRTRPTAVNLFWALDRMKLCFAENRSQSLETIRSALLKEAQSIHTEDEIVCRAIGEFGADLIPDGATVLTHCNAGALATADHGTALAVIRAAVNQGKKIRVLADETRPYLQGARLTSWELYRDGIDVTVICDSAAGHFLSRGDVDAVVVGSDRTVANGDVCNKIGTYPLAVLCHENDVPFYAAVPRSTIDLTLESGADIPIEERPAEEVTMWGGRRTVPEGVAVRNPAFDVTPSKYVTGVITEVGVAQAPYETSLAELMAQPDPKF